MLRFKQVGLQDWGAVGGVQGKQQGWVHSHSSLRMEVDMDVFSLEEQDKIRGDRRQSVRI